MESEKDIMEQVPSDDKAEIDSEVHIDASITVKDGKNIPEEILKKLDAIESSDQYVVLRKLIDRNSSLLTNSQHRLVSVKQSIQYANKYIKELSDNFLKVLLDTGWFEKYFDAVCLFNKAHESKEAMEWCVAMKESLETSITEQEAYKIKVLLSKRFVNVVFTLSTKTPYLRISEGVFNDIAPFVSVQSRTFYSWLKNIETLSLLLRNLWLELEYPSVNVNKYCSDGCLQLEEANTGLVSYIKTYLEETIIPENDCLAREKIRNEVEEFENNIGNIIEYYENQYEQNEVRIKYLTNDLLNDYYKKDLEHIYGIYDGIQLSISALQTKFEECEERERWGALLKNLSEVIIKFLSIQNINLSPELVIGKSHIENSKFVTINNQEIDFFSFAKITSATEAPREELKDCVASISNYGFYYIDSDNNIKIIRETKVSVYN